MDFANLTPEQIQAWIKTLHNNSLQAGQNNDRYTQNQGGDGAGGMQGVNQGFTGDDLGGNMYPTYDAQGNFTGVKHYKPNNMTQEMIKGGLLVGGTVLGAGALNGAFGGAGAGLGAGGSDLATSAAWVNGAGLGGDTLSAVGADGLLGSGVEGAGLVELGIDGSPLLSGETAATGLLEPGAVEAAEAGTAGTTAATTAGSTAAKTAGLLGSLGATDLAKIAAIGLGAAAGSKPTTTTSTAQSKTDPRIDPYIYGDDGILAQAKKWQQANQTGLNSQMLEGLNMQYNVNANPENMGAYQQMQRLGSGLMSAPIAGNPFTSNGTKNLGFSNQNAGLLTPNASPYKQPTYMK